MTVSTSNQLFVLLLNNVRDGTERAMKIFREMHTHAQDSRIKDALDAWIFVSANTLSKLDQCLKLLGEGPISSGGHMHGLLAEGFRRELSAVEAPGARHLLILAKASQLVHLRIGEYIVLIPVADNLGRNGIGLLLESCLGDALAFAEELRELVPHTVSLNAFAAAGS